MELKQSSDPFLQLPPAPRDQLATAQRANEGKLIFKLEDHNFQYYEEYRRLYHTAYLLSFQLKQLAQTKQELWVKLGKLEVNYI